jgi:glycosyltransferase involved in cell wall biosynthesis
MKFSLVIPVYQNEASIQELLDVISGMNRQLNDEFEAVFVVDGSPDRSYAVLSSKLPHCDFTSQLVLHSRNYGSFAAIRTGLTAARGKYFAVMSADLQEPPELAIRFFHALSGDEADILVGTRDSRDDPLPSRITSRLFWSLYRRFVIPDMPAGGVDIFGCNTQFRNELLNLEESHSSMIGLIFWLGFRRKTVGYHRRVRKHGVSAWTVRKKITYLMDSIFSFSDFPIRLLIAVGLIGIAFSIGFGILVAVSRLLGFVEPTGYAATVIIILFFGGLNAMGLGIIGAYVWRAYGNTQGRPLAVVMQSKVFNGEPTKPQ